MQRTAIASLALPKRQAITDQWLHNLAEAFPAWDQRELGPLALAALRHFYAFVDSNGQAEVWDVQEFLNSSEAPVGLSFRDLTRIFIALRVSLRKVIGMENAQQLTTTLEWLDRWLDLSLGKLDESVARRSQERQAEIAQRMATLNALNHCAAALNASLDLPAALDATVQLALELTEADLTMVFFLDGDNYALKASAWRDPDLGARLPAPRQMIGSGVTIDGQFIPFNATHTIIIDEQQQDMPLEASRLGVGIPQIQAVICVPLIVGQVTLGRVTACYMTPQRFQMQRIRLLEIFASHAGQAISNAQLYEQLGTLILEQERHRLACEMHDTMLQTLVSLNINLRVAIGHARREDWSQALQVLDEAHALGKMAVREGRETLHGLRSDCTCGGKPNPLQGMLQAEIAMFTRQSGIQPEVAIDPEILLSYTIGHQVRRMVGEALTNTYRHARATAVSVTAAISGGELVITVIDNGIGFTAEGAARQGAYGLAGMRERARLIGAALAIYSEPGCGTHVEIRWPFVSPS